MKEEKPTIDVVFLGSPGDGFSSFPSTYSNLVSGYDRAERSYRLDCFYEITAKQSIVKYIEYGLTGNGEHGTSRGGRNFGIWITIEGHMVTPKGQKKLLAYLKEFVEQGIVKNANVLEVKGKTKNYTIFSFGEVANKLEKLQDAFKEYFISDFENEITPIQESAIGEKDLNPKEKVIPKNSESPCSTFSPTSTWNPQNKKPSHSKTKKEKSTSGNNLLLYIIIVGLLFIILMQAMVWFSMEKLENKLSLFLNNIERTVSTNQTSNTIKVQTKNEPNEVEDKEEEEIIEERPLSYTVKSGDNLKQIVMDYNKLYNTKFTTEEIEQFNNIMDRSKISIDQIIEFPK